MGGAGSGRLSRTDELIRKTTSQGSKSKQPEHESRVPIMTEMFLPNLSGDHSAGNVQKTPVAATDIANKAYVDAHGGVTDHSALSNLTYATAGHTGFLPAANPTFTGVMTGGTFSGSGAVITGTISGASVWAQDGGIATTGTVSGAKLVIGAAYSTAPTILSTADTDTGIGWTTTNMISFYAGGSRKLDISTASVSGATIRAVTFQGTNYQGTGDVAGATFKAAGSPGVDGNFTTADGKNVTVTKGIITACA